VLEGERVTIEAIETAASADPEDSILIFIQRKDVIRNNAVWFGGVIPIMNHLVGGFCEAIQPRFGTEPYIPIGINKNGKDHIGADRMGVGGVIPVIGKVIALTVVLVNPAAESSKPEHAAAVFVDRENMIAAQAAGVSRIVLVVDEALAGFA
jgi:hypothetical protein